MGPIAPHPCPICDAPSARREHLPDGFELCLRCGFAVRLDEDGSLVAWATTNKSHPRGVWAAALVLAAVVGVIGCATAMTTPQQRAARAPAPAVVFREDLPAELLVCVPRLLATATLRYACLPLGDLRALLRSRRLAGDVSTEDWP